MKPVSAFKTRASPKASETPTPGDAGRLKRSGRQRPKFQRILDQIRPGDVIVVWKLDRLARSTRDLLNTMDTVNEAGGKFQFISEPWANIP